jgi:hypothetical protein
MHAAARRSKAQSAEFVLDVKGVRALLTFLIGPRREGMAKAEMHKFRHYRSGTCIVIRSAKLALCNSLHNFPFVWVRRVEYEVARWSIALMFIFMYF